MNLKEIKKHLAALQHIQFQLPDGSLVPEHFHVTEVGKVNKEFIDCGGTIRQEEVVNFQLWNANDYDHRLHPEKLMAIIQLSQEKLGIEDSHEIEVEYQGRSIEKYSLGINDDKFLLLTKQTDCLAKDKCGIPEEKPVRKLADLSNSSTSACAPGSGCC